MNLSRILKIVAFIISIIAVYYFVQVSSYDTMKDGGTEADEAALNAAVAGFISFTKILLILIGLILAAFIVWDVIKHPKNLKRTLIGIALFVGLYFLSTLFAGSEKVISADFKTLAEEGSSLSKKVSTGIWFSAILGFLAFLGFAVDSLRSLFK